VEHLRNRFEFGRDQRETLIAYLAVIIASVGLTFALIYSDGFTQSNEIRADLRFVLLGSLIACAGLFLSRNYMGGHGAIGAARAVVGFIIITYCVSVIAATLVSPFSGLLYGPSFLVNLFEHNPIFIVVWCIILFEIHRLLKRDINGASPRNQNLRWGNVSNFTRKNLR